AQKVQALALHSQSIGGVIQVISTIADQTNLLALNAAIEA
ncbi:methyl-accepting chemotaxis protein, partial [Pseudomonas amygdali pv. morsprunorum]